MLLPIYPCNIIMWLLVVCAFCKKRENKILNYIVEFSAIGGTVCGFIGIAFNEIFLSTPDFLDYDSLKGLLSHTTMLFGTLYLFDAYNIKIKVINNTISTFIGLMIFTIVGGIVNLLYFIFNLGECNAMFMTTPPFEDFYTIGITGLLLVFVLTNIYEFITLKKEDRWYNQLRRSK